MKNEALLREIFESGKTESEQKLLSDIYFGKSLKEIKNQYQILQKQDFILGKDPDNKVWLYSFQFLNNNLICIVSMHYFDMDRFKEKYNFYDIEIQNFNSHNRYTITDRFYQLKVVFTPDEYDNDFLKKLNNIIAFN